MNWLGNSLTVAALVRSRKLRSHATTAFVLSLAGSDLLFCAFNLPLTASRYIHESWILGDTLCRLFPFFFYGNVAASLFSMVLITINRYRDMMERATTQQNKDKQSKLFIAFKVHFDCVAFVVWQNLPSTNHRSHDCRFVAFQLLDDDTATTWNLGWFGFKWCNVLLYDSSQKWKITEKVLFRLRISYPLPHNYCQLHLHFHQS